MERHFLCNDCFGGCVASAAADDLDKQEERNGHVFCPMNTGPTPGSCVSEAWSDRVVAMKVDEDTFEQYQTAKKKLTEAAVAREMEKEKLKAIEVALKKMEELGSDVFKAQTTIVEDILTMKCPRCKNAFTDWDGCNALYCTYAGCGCMFCAFCFRDCGSANRAQARGDDAAHKCMTSHSAVAATPKQFHVITRKKQLDSLLEPLSREARAKVVRNLKTELAGHGLQEVVDKYQ